jgi:TonB family protein
MVYTSVPALAQTSFKPAEVTSATDTQIPFNSSADGIVVLDVQLDATGAITKTSVVRDIPSLTQTAILSVQAWKFDPASDGSKPQASTMPVVFAFRPRSYQVAPPRFEPLRSNQGSESAETDSGYVPPRIVVVAYPLYPMNALMTGAVVIQVAVGKNGRTKQLRVVRNWPPFTQAALDAAKKCQFQAASLNGRPIVSNLAISFVFTPIIVN